jgi:oxygen-independent coproporphyrinogen-3 oxidase
MILTSLLRILLTRSFKPFVFGNKNSAKINYGNEKNMGLYVHIPFCRTICSFCPYCKVVYHKDRANLYKKALLKEIETAGSENRSKKDVTSLYFGGGTPALMIDDLKDIIAALNRYFTIHGGIGIELHPDDITGENLSLLKDAGITMVSIGIQSFNETCLEKLGRSPSGFKEKIVLTASMGFKALDVDLLFAIPGQSEEILLQDMETAFSLGATQISTYPFIDFTFAGNNYKPLPEKTKKRLLRAINNYCRETGRIRTSVWTFAKKNTQKYSSVTRDAFLGFGVSAATLLCGEFKINTFSIDAYAAKTGGNTIPSSLTLYFTRRQRAVYYLFWSIYGLKIDAEQFEQLIGVPLEKMYGPELWTACKLGILKKRGRDYHLTDRGAYYYHYIEQVYTTAYIDKMWNISGKEDFPGQIVLK